MQWKYILLLKNMFYCFTISTFISQEGTGIILFYCKESTVLEHDPRHVTDLNLCCIDLDIFYHESNSKSLQHE